MKLILCIHIHPHTGLLVNFFWLFIYICKYINKRAGDGGIWICCLYYNLTTLSFPHSWKHHLATEFFCWCAPREAEKIKNSVPLICLLFMSIIVSTFSKHPLTLKVSLYLALGISFGRPFLKTCLRIT